MSVSPTRMVPESAHEIQERGLSRARRPEEHADLALADLRGDAFEHLDLHVSAAIALVQVGDGEKRAVAHESLLLIKV